MIKRNIAEVKDLYKEISSAPKRKKNEQVIAAHRWLKRKGEIRIIILRTILPDKLIFDRNMLQIRTTCKMSLRKAPYYVRRHNTDMGLESDVLIR